MKKLCLITLCMVLLTGCGNTPQDTPQNVEEPKQVISISNNRGTGSLTIAGVTIKNVVIIADEQQQRVEFTIESEEPLTDMKIDVSLLNNTTINKSMNLKVNKEEHSKLLIFDFTGYYNNPYQIYFNIEK